MNWLTLVVLLILIVSGFRGYRKGFVKTIFSLVSIILALIVSSIVSPMVSKTLRSNEVFYQSVQDRVETVVDFGEEQEEITKTSEETSFIENLSLPEALKKTLIENNNKSTYKDLAVSSFEEYVVSTITIMVINTLSYILCTVGLILLLFIVSHVLDLISKLPLLNELNKATGLIAGLLSGCVRIWIFFLLITLFSTTTFGENIFRMVNESQLLTFIYDNNLLLKVITNITAVLS